MERRPTTPKSTVRFDAISATKLGSAPIGESNAPVVANEEDRGAEHVPGHLDEELRGDERSPTVHPAVPLSDLVYAS